MLKRLIGGLAVVGVAYLVAKSIPDIQRYLRIRNM